MLEKKKTGNVGPGVYWCIWQVRILTTSEEQGSSSWYELVSPADGKSHEAGLFPRNSLEPQVRAGDGEQLQELLLSPRHEDRKRA